MELNKEKIIALIETQFQLATIVKDKALLEETDETVVIDVQANVDVLEEESLRSIGMIAIYAGLKGKSIELKDVDAIVNRWN